jgi:hypothetical protein
MPSQWFSPGADDAPLTYTVQGAHIETPLAAYSEYDTTGAGQAVIPALIFRSQAGNVIGIYTTDDVVADGDFTQVSWAPFLRSLAGGSGGGGGVAAIGEMWFSNSISGDPAVTVPAGAALDLPFAHTHSTDASLVAFTTVVNTNDTLLCKSTSHLYQIYSSSFWQLSGFVQQTVLQTQGATVVSGELLGNITNHPAHPADYFNLVQVQPGITQGQVDYMIVKPQVVNQKVHLNALHSSGTSKDVTFAFVVCLAFAIG